MSYAFSKRLFDVAVSAGALVATAPVTVTAAAAIFATMGRPIFFRQTRPGLHGEPFDLIKFRTMAPPPPGEDPLLSDARRITRVGKFLRETSLDEFPTFWNVLRGDMSIVGPRPLLMRYLDRYTPEQARRHDVKPGITGWSQVNGRNALSWDEKFAYDVYYVDNASFLFDLQIFFKTILKVFQREGISNAGFATMPEFMGTETLEADAAE